MHRKQVNERSPLRVLEQSIHGGLGRGNLGIVVARTGVGKTAFLVGVALDDLMRGRKVLHVCLDHSLDKARTFYDEIYADLAHAEGLDDVWKVRLELERNRRIQAYAGGTFAVERLRNTLRFLRDHEDFVPSAIVVDGWDFAEVTAGDLDAMREVAREADVELWLSAVTTREAARDERGVPEPVAALESKFDVILQMAHDGRSVHVGLLKDHDNPAVSELKLALDPRTMLLVRE